MSKIAHETYVHFHEHGQSQSGKTSVWLVKGGSGATLGFVKWFGRWRCYSFFPSDNTVYERRCLRDIAAFCESITEEHRRPVVRDAGVEAATEIRRIQARR